MKLPFSLTIILLSSLPSSHAWGSLGHETVAYIATNFVSPSTETFFQSVLDNRTSDYLAGIATWADSYRYTAAGKWSAPLHFIDAEDSPPQSCGVKYSRDCTVHGCSIGAVQNFTTQLLDSSSAAEDLLMAAKFIVHLVGDIHQPLHDEALDIGGNSVAVTFGGVKTNLHHIWDTNMPEKLIGGYSLADAKAWGHTLTTAIKSGIYESQAHDWLQGMSIGDPISTALAWATEANVFVCTTVLPDGVDALRGAELDGNYYETAIPVVQLQVARAGYRLAAWLDLIAAHAQSQQTEL